jgi:hypothetical protein
LDQTFFKKFAGVGSAHGLQPGVQSPVAAGRPAARPPQATGILTMNYELKRSHPMYLYLGQDTVVNTREIIGIFDLDNTSTSRITKRYLSHAQKNGAIEAVSDDIPKSFVVCERGGSIKVYLSQISPATLKKRSEFMKDISNL